MPFYERGNARIRYEEAGSGFPLFIIYGGGLDSRAIFSHSAFDPVEQFKSEYRCITMDLRNADPGESTGPLDLEHPWDMYTDDQLGLLAHLGVDKFLVIGFCIGNPLIWNLMKRAPGRIVAAVSAMPSAVDPKNPDHFYRDKLANWAPALCKRRPEITMDMAEKFVSKLFKNADFVITVSREFVRNCQTPLLVLPDDNKSHPYVTAMEMVSLAPNAQVSFFPWRRPKENVVLAQRHVGTFIKANTPAT